MRSAMYCGVMGSRNSVAAGRPISVIPVRIRRALRKQFGAGAMLSADHPVGDQRRKQRFDSREERDGAV